MDVADLIKEKELFTKRINELRLRINLAPGHYSDKILLEKKIEEYRLELKNLERLRANIHGRIWKKQNKEKIAEQRQRQNQRRREKRRNARILKENSDILEENSDILEENSDILEEAPVSEESSVPESKKIEELEERLKILEEKLEKFTININIKQE